VIKYNFLVDKEACFAYWAQSLIKWSWYFEQKEFDYHQGLFGPFTDGEEKSLKLLASILNKKGNYFNWLWSRYGGQKISDEEESKSWIKIRTTLDDKFERMWKIEEPKLKKWSIILSNYESPKLNEIYSKIFRFFDVKEQHLQIDVKLLFHWDSELPTAHVQRNFEKIMILNISNVKEVNIPEVINILTHETIHKIEYKSLTLPNLIENSFRQIIRPVDLDIQLEGLSKEEQWRHLLTETIIGAIASRRFNTYVGRELAKDVKQIEADKIFDFNFTRDKNNHGLLIRVVASKIEALTAEYLYTNKVISQQYCDKVATTWLELEGR